MSGGKTSKPSFAAWVIWGIGSLFLLYQFLLQTSSSVMIPELERAFQINPATVGILSSSFFYTYFFMQVPAGILIDRFGARYVLSICLVICSIAVMLFAYAHTVMLATCARMLMGLVAASAFTSALYLAANWFPARQFAAIAGLTEAMAMLGGILGESYLALSVKHFGWRETMTQCAIVGVVMAILVVLIVRNYPGKKSNTNLHLTEAPLLPHVLICLKQIMGLPQVWVIGLFSALTFALVTALAGLWGVPFLEVHYHLPVTLAAIANSMILVGVGCGSPCLGWLSERIGKRKPVMFGSTLLCLIIMCVIIYVVNLPLWLMFILLFMLGFTAGIYMLPFVLVREITNKEVRGTAIGFTNMLCIFIGSPILQPLIGKLLEMDWDHYKKINGVPIFHLADYQIALTTLPVALFFALITLLFIRETHCQETVNLTSDSLLKTMSIDVPVSE